ncbi:MAG: enoyl-CoA hydratase/isomerase family protein [Rhodospirillales bacterium]|nr:enoyl-CoA hydratase/isomerase family protein [Rhodospirillales bacterium]
MARKPAAAKKPAKKPAKKAGKYEYILTAKRKGALEITFNRPDKLNALNEPMAGEIMDAMASVENDRKILCVILQGDERAFCAGADLSGFSDKPQERYDNYRARYNTRKNRLLFHYVQAFTKPVISAVEGYCLGGGFELAMFGDIIIAGEAAQFGLPEGRHSLIPGAGGTQNLPRIIGAALAKELIWTARRIGAEEALGLRIVNHVMPKGKALAKAREIVEQMMKIGPLSIMMSKQSIDRGLDMSLAQGFQQEADLSYLLTWSEDRKEGLTAFAERRPAKFKGQ